MLATLLTLLISIVLIVSVILRLKRGQQAATRRRVVHREPHLAPEKKEEALVEDGDDALGLRPAVKTVAKPAESVAKAPVEFIAFHVVAPKEYPYSGYELLQTLLANGLRYGENNIFHRHETKTGRGPIFFSVASVNKPGTFELTKMGNYTCPGLTLFMVLKREIDSMLAFDTLLETARQLTEDLGGEILDAERQVLNMDKVAEIRARIRRFEETQRMPDFFNATPLES